MSMVRNLPIARKFTYAFGIISLLCVGLAVYTFITLRGVAAKAADVGVNGVPSVVELATMRNDANNVRRAGLALLLCQSADCITHYQQVRSKSAEEAVAAAKAYEPLMTLPGERELYQKFSSNFAQYMEVSNRAMAALSAGHKDEASQLLLSASAISLHAVALAAADEDLQLNAREANQEAAAMAADATRTEWISVFMTLAIVAFCVVIGMQLNRFVTPRIRNVMDMVQKFAAKDLTAHVQATANRRDRPHGRRLQRKRRLHPRGSALSRSGRGHPVRGHHGDQRPRRRKAPATPTPSPARPTRSPPRRRR